MDTPITSSQVPHAVSLVAERKAHYLDKRAKVKGGEEVQVSSSDMLRAAFVISHPADVAGEGS